MEEGAIVGLWVQTEREINVTQGTDRSRAGSHGKISLNGSNITRLPTEERVASGLSFVPQGNRVFAELSVRENIEVGGYLLPKEEVMQDRMESVATIISRVYGGRLKQTAGQLSGGEKQQLALCRALMLKPKLLDARRAFPGLSPKLVTRAFDTIKSINTSLGTTILIVEQKVRELLRIVQRVQALRMEKLSLTEHRRSCRLEIR